MVLLSKVVGCLGYLLAHRSQQRVLDNVGSDSFPMSTYDLHPMINIILYIYIYHDFKLPPFRSVDSATWVPKFCSS